MVSPVTLEERRVVVRPPPLGIWGIVGEDVVGDAVVRQLDVVIRLLSALPDSRPVEVRRSQVLRLTTASGLFPTLPPPCPVEVPSRRRCR